jgi:hypothetical protein
MKAVKVRLDGDPLEVGMEHGFTEVFAYETQQLSVPPNRSSVLTGAGGA